MARAGSELLSDAGLIVPVPLHRWRLLARRYNQAAVLAMALGRQSGVAVQPDLLVRRRRTPAMGHLTRDERRNNVKGAFAVRAGKVPLVAGGTVLLVDDVLTTGATVGECARVLLAAGARAVDVLTLGRVVLDR
jgi:ComF family protein